MASSLSHIDNGYYASHIKDSQAPTPLRSVLFFPFSPPWISKPAAPLSRLHILSTPFISLSFFFMSPCHMGAWRPPYSKGAKGAIRDKEIKGKGNGTGRWVEDGAQRRRKSVGKGGWFGVRGLYGLHNMLSYLDEMKRRSI
jgi:hypothetical protein